MVFEEKVYTKLQNSIVSSIQECFTNSVASHFHDGFSSKELHYVISNVASLTHFFNRVTENAIEFSCFVNARLIEDSKLLKTVFSFEANNISDCRVVGDLHDLSKAVLILEDLNGKKIVFKPRSISSFCYWNTLLSAISSYPGIKSHMGNNYGWIEFVEESALGPNSCFNFGCVIALAYATNTSDLIAENFIKTEWGPMPIDVEVLCRPVLKGEDQIENSLLTISGTGILPNAAFDKTTGFDSIFSQVLDQFGTSALDEILDGFENAYNFISDQKFQNEALAILEKDSPQCRLIFRHTATYESVLSWLSHPESNSNDQVITFLNSDVENNRLRSMIPFEISQLENFDVPCFYYNPEKNYIYNREYGQVSKNIVYRTGYELLKEKFKAMSTLDLIRCKNEIRVQAGSVFNIFDNVDSFDLSLVIQQSSFDLFGEVRYFGLSEIGYRCYDNSFFEGKYGFGCLDFKGVDQIAPSAIYLGVLDTAFYFLVKYREERNLSYLKKSIDTYIEHYYSLELSQCSWEYYNGLSGVLSFGLELVKEQINTVNIELVSIVDHLVEFILEQDYSVNTQTGFAHGLAGVIYTLAKATEILGVNAEQMILSLIELEDKYFETDKFTWTDLRGGDYCGGENHAWCNGSIGIYMSRLKAGIQYEDAIVIDILNYLEKNFQKHRSYGFCHGISGFLELILIFKDKNKSISDQLTEVIERLMISIPKDFSLDLTFFTGLSGFDYFRKTQLKNGATSPLTFETYGQ